MNLANYTEHPDEMTHRIVTELDKCQFHPNLTTNFRGTLLAKVVFNSVVNTLCTLFEITMGEFAAYPGADELSRQLIDEAYDVCERDGVTMLNTRAEELASVNYVSKVANPSTTHRCIKICLIIGQLKSTISMATSSSSAKSTITKQNARVSDPSGSLSRNHPPNQCHN